MQPTSRTEFQKPVTPRNRLTEPSRHETEDQRAPRRSFKDAHDPNGLFSDRLVERIGKHRFGMWFDHTTKIKITGNTIDVAAESQFVADWIRRHFTDDLEAVARETLGNNASIGLHVAPEAFRRDGIDGQQAQTPGSGASTHITSDDDQDARGPRSRTSSQAVSPEDAQRYGPRSRRRSNDRRQMLRQLQSFVIGGSNRLAYQASLSMAEEHEAAPKMLFLHGECGIGKTHLLQGVIDHRIRASKNALSSRRVRYVTGEEFTNEYIAAVRGGKIDNFRSRIRQLDLLAIDDIHFLSNKTATQNEFLHTLDAINLSGASIVLASDEHPRQIGRFSASLTSRFLAGMVVRIGRPDIQMREEMVRCLAEQRDLQLTEAAARLLAGRFSGSVRELNGALMKLAALRRLDGTRGGAVGAIMVEQMFEGESAPGPRTPVRLGEIIDSVCQRLGIEPDELLGRGRHRRVVLARSLVVHLARSLTTLSFPEIARGLGRENHSTVHTAARRIEADLAAAEAAMGEGNYSPRPLPLPDDAEITLRELVEQLKYDVSKRCSRR
ncbi:MAG TPA: hypothetical protein DCX60_08050 [Phycisphaerales bacterium]|nr:hypothetical protein [Phycisphaerales bacterium]